MVNEWLAQIDLGAACLLFLTGLPLAAGKVRRNRWYGFRLPKTLASDEAWYGVNRYGGRLMVLWSALPLVAAPIVGTLPAESPFTYPVGVGAIVVASIVPSVAGVLRSTRY